MASQLFASGVILMFVQQIYSQKDLPNLPKAAHKDFDSEWYPKTQEWVSENYDKDSIERNRKLVAFTNNLETTFIDNLRNITKRPNLTSNEIEELIRNKSLDTQVISFYFLKYSCIV